jgi:superfamily II RNA helicase
MTGMFDPDWDPVSKILELEGTTLQLCEQFEEMSGQHVNNAWILEEMTKQMVEVSEAINKMADVIVNLRRRIVELESKI